MHPILLKLGPLTIYSYGVMVALGFGISTLLICRRSPRFGIDQNKIIDIAIAIIISGIVGARIFYILFNAKFYIANPQDIFKLSKGGLVWYGGFLSSMAASIFFIRRKRLDFWKVMDLIAPYAALAQGFGRIGCFLNGCCYGVTRVPVQLISAAALFVIYLILRYFQDKKHFPGAVFLGYCALYPFKRFIMEFFRADNPRIYFGMSFSQGLSIVVFFAALFLFIYRDVQWKKRNTRLP